MLGISAKNWAWMQRIRINLDCHTFQSFKYPGIYIHSIHVCVGAHVHWTDVNMVPCVYEVMHEMLKVNASVIIGEISLHMCVCVNLSMSHTFKTVEGIVLSSKLKEKNSLLVTLFSWNVCCKAESGMVYLHSITLPTLPNTYWSCSVWTVWFLNTVKPLWDKHCYLKFGTQHLTNTRIPDVLKLITLIILIMMIHYISQVLVLF